MTQNIDRQELAKKAHAASVAKGFWDEKHSQEHYLMFVVMDLSGAVEAHQVSHRADYEAHKRALNDPTSTEGVIARSMGEDLINEIAFEEHIAYTLEDRLADAYIRLLDLAKGFGYDIELKDPKILNYKELLECVSKHSFVEGVFNVAGSIGFQKIDEVIHEGIPYLLSSIEALATAHGIDLAWHITEKMRYNETRPARHGKEY